MPRMLRFAMFLIGGLTLLLLAVLLCIYLGLRHEPSFYRKALTIERKELDKGSDRMLQNAAALQSALAKAGRWKIRVTAEEINGWLAVDLAKNHPGALPPSLSDPRVAISPHQLAAACRYDSENIKSVLSLAVEPYLAKPNVVALRVIRARAGMVPLPLNKVLDALSQAASNLRLQVEWRHSGADPVAMLTLPGDDDKLVVHIDSIQLGDGEITVVGATERRKR